MKNILLAMSVLIFSVPALAGEAEVLQVEDSISIMAPADQVWDKVKNFGDLGAWHPAVKSTQVTQGKNNTKGAMRLLTLQDDGTIKEELLDYQAKKMMFKYSIIESVLPVSQYVSTLMVKAESPDSSVVVWSGNFKRKDTSSSPVAGQDDEAAVKTITSVYRGGLENLKKILESQ